jgi:hypothetical protein
LVDGIGGGISTDCAGLEPAAGDPCDEPGTVCGLDGEGDQVCFCTNQRNDPAWRCIGLPDPFGGFGGNDPFGGGAQ